MANNLDYQTLEQSPTQDSNSFGGILQTGMLNELLRKQLSPTQNAVSSLLEQDNPLENVKKDEPVDLRSSAVSAIEELLNNPVFDRDVVHHKLSNLFHYQKEIYENAPIDATLRKRQFITHCGLVMSPDNCITTQLDDLRVRAFIRGTHAAIQQKKELQQGAIHIVYPACGPFAPLLMPLISYYHDQQLMSDDELQITLIDMQPGATQSLAALVDKMGINKYIKQIFCMDATLYDPQQCAVDIVILEAMQHGFSREGQLKIAKHFATLLSPHGVFIPEKIIISAQLSNLQQEFVLQWNDVDYVSENDRDKQTITQRINLGDIFTVTAQSLRDIQEIVLDQHSTLIECGTVQIPNLPVNHQKELILCTKIHTWGDEWIGEYDSGITHPLPDQNICINFTPKEKRAGDLLLKSGDGLKFYYRLNGLPGFMPTWIEGDKHD